MEEIFWCLLRLGLYLDGLQSNPLSTELYAPWTSKALCSMGASREECCEKEMIMLQCWLPSCSDPFSVTGKMWCANGRHAVIREVQKYSCNTVSKPNGGKSFLSLGQLHSAGGFTDGHSCGCGCVNIHSLNTPFWNRYVRVEVTATLKRAGVTVKFAPGICFGS